MSDEYKTRQPVKIQEINKIVMTDTLQSWIVRLNAIIDLTNVMTTDELGHIEFGYISARDKEYLDNLRLHIVPSTGNVLNVTSNIIDTTNLKLSHVNKRIKHYIINNDSSSNTISINHDSIGTIEYNSTINSGFDIAKIDAYRNITLSFASGSNNIYSEMIVCINAKENIIITYECSETWRFVNNGIQPNVNSGLAQVITSEIDGNENTSISQLVSYSTNETLLKKDNSLVLKFILFGDEILVSVIDNTQLVQNYKNDDYYE